MSDTPGETTAARPSTALVCFAVREESKFFATPDSAEDRVKVLLTGIGQANAARALGQALTAWQPDLILTCGFAGGLNPALPVGAVVFSSDPESGLHSLLCELGASPAVFHCHDRIATRVAEKAALRQSTGADAVEMESEVIRQLCRQRHLPSATIRAISDTAGEDLPLDFNALMTSELEIDNRKLAWALVRAPGRIAPLLGLQRHVKQAAQNLGRVLEELLRRRLRPAG